MASAVKPGEYDAIADPYCYPDTTVLKNIPDIREQAALGEFETVSTAQRADEPLPNGRLSVRHYQAIHYHLFQDVYAWMSIDIPPATGTPREGWRSARAAGSRGRLFN